MSNTRLIVVCLLVLLSICFVSVAQETLNRPTRPEKFTRPEEVHEYIRKFKEYLDRSANPRYGKRFYTAPVRKMRQDVYLDDTEDSYEPYKIYDSIF